MRNSAEHATALKAVSRFLQILVTINATMRETHRGTGQDVPDNVTVSPNVSPLDSGQLSLNVSPLDSRQLSLNVNPLDSCIKFKLQR